MVPTFSAIGITKNFGRFTALRGVSVDLAPGDFLVIFGRNGAGKSTFLNIASTLMKPTSGTLCIMGKDALRESEGFLSRIGYLSHYTYLYSDFTAYENLCLFAALYSLPDAGERIDELLNTVGLYLRRNDLIRNYSRGMQQRLAIARTFLHNPSFVLLDEPYTGLDFSAAGILTDLLKKFQGENRTVIMTTHHLEQGLALANRASILHRGKFAYQTAKEDITKQDFQEIYKQYVT